MQPTTRTSRKPRTTALLLLATFAATLTSGLSMAAEASRDADRALLKRVYQMRMQLERDSQIANNEARANVQLVRQQQRQTRDAPSVGQMRRDMNLQLSKFEQSLRCLDVDVENNGGNTVVICGGNSGDISGENTTAARDIVTVPGMPLHLSQPLPQPPPQQATQAGSQ